MTTLAADKRRNYGLDSDARYIDVPCVATDIVYEGSAVGESSSDGTARPLVGADTFIGFCVRRCDNAAGAAEARKVRVLTRGSIADFPVTGLDNINDYGAAVYAVDDNSFTLTSSTGHTQIGKVLSYDGVSGFGTIYFEGASVRSV